MAQLTKSGITVDIRGGSFCIFDSESLKTLSLGEVETFRTHEHMRAWAMSRFDQLVNKRRDKNER